MLLLVCAAIHLWIVHDPEAPWEDETSIQTSARWQRPYVAGSGEGVVHRLLSSFHREPIQEALRHVSNSQFPAAIRGTSVQTAVVENICAQCCYPTEENVCSED